MFYSFALWDNSLLKHMVVAPSTYLVVISLNSSNDNTRQAYFTQITHLLLLRLHMTVYFKFTFYIKSDL